MTGEGDIVMAACARPSQLQQERRKPQQKQKRSDNPSSTQSGMWGSNTTFSRQLHWAQGKKQERQEKKSTGDGG